MIDMHTHILPSIDDGANSVEQSLEMIGLLQADGVKQIVCTPHFYWQKRSIGKFISVRDEAMQKLATSPIPLVPAAEVEFGEQIIDYSYFSKLRIGDTRYILIELPYADVWSRRLFSNIDMLMQETGLIPIIAHIDRYKAPLNHPSFVEDLISMGCILQANADAVVQAKRHSLIDVLLSYGQIQVLGSDCHNTGRRAPHYGAAVEKIQAWYGRECVDFLMENMKKILANEKVPEVDPYLARKFMRFYW